MKRPLYYLLCAIACTSMVGATMPMAAIAEAIQPQEIAAQQAQADTSNSATGKAKHTTNTNATADSVEDSTATPADTNSADTESADATNAGTIAADATNATMANDSNSTAATPTPSLRTQTTPTPESISTAAATAYAHSATATQNGVTFTVSWNDAPAGTATTFHVTQANGSSQAKARMDVPTYWDGGSQESVCDPSRQAWASYHDLGTAGHDFTFDFTASGTYRVYFYFMDNDRNDPQNDKGIYYLRTAAEVTVNDAARPSVTQIVNDAVTQCRQETNGSEYDMALWLHDWTLDQLEYDHSLNWCSAESGLTRHQGTCESYQRIYSKLLNAAGIANGRITGNGHTWNAVKIDGKWCQMDLTWDDTSDNWYGDLDQRHLYFGLTDELMAIAHSDHTTNYQKDDYAYRSTDLSNNYFVRNGKADKWAEKYADRIQQHLDAKEEGFSIDADNQSFPPSISGIQNGIVAYAMNLREWETGDAKVELTAASNVTKESNSKWSAKYQFTASYQIKTITAVLPDGDYRLSTSLDTGLALCPEGSSVALASRGQVLSLARDASSGLYRVTAADGSALTYKGGKVSFSPEGEGRQLWLVRADLDGYALLTSDGSMALDVPGASASDGAKLQLFAANGTRAQRWKASEAPARTLPDGEYRLSTSLDTGLALCPEGSSAALASRGQVLSLARDASSGLYRVTAADGSALTYKGGKASFSPEGEGRQLWLVRADLDGYALLTSDGSMALDVPGASASDGAKLQLFAANGTRAQRWKASEAPARTLPDGEYRLSTSLDTGLALCPEGSSAALASRGQVLSLARDASSGLYRVTAADGSALTYKGGKASFSPEGEGRQLWLVRADLDGYALLTSDGSMALDVPGASASDGAKLQLFAANGTRAQRWKASEAPARTLPDGEYRLSTSLDTGLALCPEGSSAALASRGQVLSLARDASSGLYRVTAADGSALTYKGGKASFSPEGEGRQLWLVRADLDGYALLTSDGSMALDVPGASASDGAKLQLFAANGTRAQRWKASEAPARTLPDGEYRLSTSLDTGLALCPEGSSAALASRGQVLSLARDASSGLYRVTAADGSALTYKGGKASFSPEGEGRQLWLVRADLDGYALLTSDGSMALDVPGASASDGAKLQLFAANGTRAQRWKTN